MKDKLCEGCPFLGHPYVGPEGPQDAKIVIIGEAPGKNEEEKGRPFIGGAGKVLNMLLRSAGIDRKEVYITNVLKCRPPKNNLYTPDAFKAISCCKRRLYEELGELHPAVTVPTGNAALQVLGYDYKITHARGSILNSKKLGKIIPTWHPAYIMRQWQEFYTGQVDWRKIKEHSEYGNVPEHPEHFNVFPKILDVEMFAMQVCNRAAAGENVQLALDIETFKGNPSEIPIKTIGMALNSTHAIVVPFLTQGGDEYWGTEDELRRAIEAIGRILQEPNVTKICHNSLFDIYVLMNHGFTIAGDMYDTEIAQYLIFHPSAHSLEYLVSIYADYQAWKLEAGVTDKAFREYNARDCVVLHMIKPKIDSDMRDNRVQYIFDILMNVILPTCRMMMNGIHVDLDKVEEVSTMLNADVNKSLQKLFIHAGQEFNPNSPQQLGNILFNQMGLKSGVKTKSKASKSTAEDVLKKLAIRYPDNHFVEEMLNYRKLDKRRGTYIGNLSKNLHEDSRIRSSFKLHTAVTGRYASSGPNVQNLPQRSDPDGYIRGMYRAPAGYAIIEADYSQVELMIFAVLANDEPWLQNFADGEDVHANNMKDMLGYYDPKYRTFIKNFVYGLIYGSEGGEVEKVAPKELMQVISVKQMLHNLQRTHPAIFEYRFKIAEQINKNKYVTNAFNRRRYYTSKPTKADLRSAVNFPIQSTAADIMHLKTPLIDEAIDWPQDKLILQLHDAYYIEALESRVNAVASILKEVMEEPVHTPTGYTFNLKVEIEHGPSLAGKEMTKWQPPVQIAV